MWRDIEINLDKVQAALVVWGCNLTIAPLLHLDVQTLGKPGHSFRPLVGGHRSSGHWFLNRALPVILEGG